MPARAGLGKKVGAPITSMSEADDVMLATSNVMKEIKEELKKANWAMIVKRSKRNRGTPGNVSRILL